MAANSPNLIWLRSFEASARLLNFTEAGRELGLTQTAISLHIKSLEARLGCKLFVRNARHISLSAMGQAYFNAVGESLANIDLATSSLFGASAKATVTVRVPISTASMWLAPLLPTFTRQHPHINIRLISTIWATSIADEDVDVDIRQGAGNWHGLEAERISTETIVVIQPPDTAIAKVTQDLLHARPLIQILGYEDMWGRYLSAHGYAGKAPKPALVVDTTAVAIALVASGGGNAAIQTRFAKAAIDAGAQVASVGDPVPFPQAHYIIHGKSKRKQRPEVEMFREWLRAEFAREFGNECGL
ncbi:MAG: LysR substrate-binding domain-containing protein [Sulfitobacter sp.]